MAISKETIKARELFSKRLSILLREHDINQNELAKSLNVSESTVGKWILGKSMPRTMGIIQNIADKFGVGKSFLLEETPKHAVPAPAPEIDIDPLVLEIAQMIKERPAARNLFNTTKKATDKELIIAANLLDQLNAPDGC